MTTMLAQTDMARPDGEFSDSRASAFVVSVAGREALSRMGGKFCVLDSSGAYMYNEGWTKHTDGNYYSNMHWDWKPAYTKSYSSYKGISLFDEACDVIEEDARFERQADRHFRKTEKGLLSLGETLNRMGK